MALRFLRQTRLLLLELQFSTTLHAVITSFKRPKKKVCRRSVHWRNPRRYNTGTNGHETNPIVISMSRSVLRSVLELRAPLTRLPPTFLLPFRARHFNSTTPIVEPAETEAAIPTRVTQQGSSTPSTASLSSGLISSSSKLPSNPPTPPTTPLSVSDSVRQLLPVLAAQPAHYITVHLHGKPYLVTVGDSIRLPFRMPGVLPGDVLRLNRASVLGSRDLTLQAGGGGSSQKPSSTSITASPTTVTAGAGYALQAQREAGSGYIDERLFECRAVVLGEEAEPMRELVKRKRRNRKRKTVRSKHRYTVLRISELKINTSAV